MKFKYSSLYKIWIENSPEQELRWQMKENVFPIHCLISVNLSCTRWEDQKFLFCYCCFLYM